MQIIHNAPTTELKSTLDMDIGDILHITEPTGCIPDMFRYGHILKTYLGFVYLEDPRNTWDNNPGFKGELYKTGCGKSLTVII